MSLMQQAYDTYCYAEKSFAGVYNAGEKEPLAPVGHSITKADIEIVIDGNGRFISANTVAKGEEKTIFPVTEESAGRTSKPVPHPLCDQLQYLIPFGYESKCLGEKKAVEGDCASSDSKYRLYVEQLTSWAESRFTHPVLTSVLSYIKKKTIYEDLLAAGLIKIDEKKSIKNEKDFIRFIVNGIGAESGPCWTNRNLQRAFVEWYGSVQAGQSDFCMISGRKAIPAKQHAKGVVALNGNAKIISANDSNGFTFRGRFLSDKEALNVSYETSQKAHNALRWIVANHGEYIGGRCFACWNPQGKKLPKPGGIMIERKPGTEAAYTPTAYKEQLRKTILSWKSQFPKDEKAITVVLDAATTGRLSVNYYSEIQAKDFIERLGYWDETCCWINGDYGIQSPPLMKIIEYATGTLRSSGFEADDNIKKQVMVQLLACRLEKAVFPVSIERALVQKAGNLQIVPDDKEHGYLRRSLLFTACAAIRKYYIDHFKEEWEMSLDPLNKDRSYQFGRWMAIMEKIEKDTYESSDKRETNIIRRQHAFTGRPYATAVSVMGHLKTAYYPQLPVSTRSFYERKIEEIVEIISEDAASINKPLSDTYLLGYYLQKKELYTSNKEKTEE